MITDELVFRQAESDDLQQINKLQGYGNLRWSLESLKPVFQLPYQTFIVMDGKRICAFLIIQSILDEAEILNIVVDPDYRNKGIALRLMEHFFKYAQARLISRCYLEVAVNNLHAIHLYKKSGFIETAKRKGYYQDGQDALIMEKLV